jgi:transcriptional regulator with XRE-family HTH domain
MRKMTPIANSLKALREKHKLSQTFVATKLNMSSSTLSNYESGTREPSLEKVKIFADFYGVPVDYLFGLGNSQFIFLSGQEKQNYEDLKKLWEEKPETLKTVLWFVTKIQHDKDKDLISLLEETAAS